MAQAGDVRGRYGARLRVLVFDLTGQPVKATVECRTTQDRKYYRLQYDERLQRYVGSRLAAGPCKLRVRGPRGTAPENRDIEIHPGDNHISVMVAPPGLPSLRTPDGGSWYFESRPGMWLLHVWGKNARDQVSRILHAQEIPYNSVGADGVLHPDDVLLEIKLGQGRRGTLRKRQLEQVVADSLPSLGLRARVSMPGYVAGKVAFGITDEIVIRFQSAATPSQISTVAERYGLAELRKIVWMGNARLFRYSGGISLAMLDRVKEIHAHELVVYAEPNVTNLVESFNYTPADYLYPETPHLQLIEADQAWDTIQTRTNVPRGGSPDIVIGILDLYGVDPAHPDLTGVLSDGSAKQIANFDFIHESNQTAANLALDHGTQCSGSATAQFDNGSSGTCGVAPNCKLIGAQFSRSATELEKADIWVWMAGFPTGSIDPAFPPQLVKGADVISNSWGANASTNQTLRDAFDFLTTYPRNGRGVVMVFAAGNYGYVSMDNNPYASDPKTLAVGASIQANPTNPVDSVHPDHNGNTKNLPAVVDTRAYYSTYGMAIDLVSPSSTCMDPNLVGLQLRDPIMAPVRAGAARTLSTVLANAGGNTIQVISVAGFAVGSLIAIGTPGAADIEAALVTAVGASKLTVNVLVGPGTFVHPHPAGTPVIIALGDWPAFPASSTSLTGSVTTGARTLNVASVAGFTVGSVVLLGTPGTVKAETTVVTGVGTGKLTVNAVVNSHPAMTTVATGPPDYAKNTFVGFGGTSHASPTVAGAAALLLSVKPDLNWIEVRSILRNSARKIDLAQPFPTGQWIDEDGDGAVDFSQWYGYGCLDVNAAVTAAIDGFARADVVVRDNLADSGIVPSTGWHASSPDIWVRKNNDPIPVLPYGAAGPHENPEFGQDNWVYLRVRNTGAGTAPVVFVRALIANFPGMEFQYPHDWEPTPRFGDAPGSPLEPGTYLIGEAVVNNLEPQAIEIVKMVWPQDLVPPQTVTIGGSTVHWHPCLLAEAAPHDGPAIVTGLPYPVQGDNNIAQLNVTIDYAQQRRALRFTAVAVGTRAGAGVDSLVVDRTSVPRDRGLVLRTPDVDLMRQWIDLVRSGKRFAKTEPLGTVRSDDPRIDLDDELLVERFSVTLLERARLAVRYGDSDTLVIDASPQTRLRMIARPGSERTPPGSVRVDVLDGQAVLRIDHGAGAFVLPMRLAANQWTPIFIGPDQPNQTKEPLGRILLSQIRGDGQLSAGYEIAI
jgi:Subtilase family